LAASKSRLDDTMNSIVSPPESTARYRYVVQTIDERTPEAIQLPHKEAIEFPCPRIGHQTVQIGPIGAVAPLMMSWS
jgi:hypothetical protein